MHLLLVKEVLEDQQGVIHQLNLEMSGLL